MANQHGTFNTIGGYQQEFGGNFVVWARVDRVLHFGGNFNLDNYKAGDVIPAGSMVIFDQVNNTVEVVKATDEAEKLAKVNGLLLNDVCIPSNPKLATGAVVVSGVIYADRAGADGIPASVEAQLPMISFIREGAEYTAAEA
jgi:hypothetical protein